MRQEDRITPVEYRRLLTDPTLKGDERHEITRKYGLLVNIPLDMSEDEKRERQDLLMALQGLIVLMALQGLIGEDRPMRGRCRYT